MIPADEVSTEPARGWWRADSLLTELLSGPYVPLMKECGNPEWTRVYIDCSRGMWRQWCGMESCGNRIKAAAYRARKKTAPVATPDRKSVV